MTDAELEKKIDSELAVIRDAQRQVNELRREQEMREGTFRTTCGTPITFRISEGQKPVCMAIGDLRLSFDFETAERLGEYLREVL